MIVCELIKGSRSEIRKADPSRRPRKRFPFVCWSGEGLHISPHFHPLLFLHHRLPPRRTPHHRHQYCEHQRQHR